MFKKLLLLLLAVSVAALPVLAQEDGEFTDPGPGNGGVVYWDNTADDPATFNPLLAADSASFDIVGWLYPSIITINPETGLEEPNLPGAMATGWEYDETGTVLTITLREDAMWNDGTPITSADYLYSVNAARSGQIESAYVSMFETLADGTPTGGKIVSVEAPDDYTVVVTFSEPDCIAFSDVNDLPMVPAHVFGELYGENYASMLEDPRAIPTVSFGPFKDIEFAPAERVSLIADQSYPDAILGYVAPSEWVYLSVPDENVATERFIAGDLSILAVPSARQREFRENAELQEFPRYEFTSNGFNFIALNHANPNNPQPGVDEEGNIIEQEPHPVLGDVRVRQAIGHAIDQQAIIDGIRDGSGIPVATHTLPTSWVYNEELQYTYDLDAARALLDEAGWVDDDGDESTPRVCQGCLHAEEGSPLAVRMRVPEGGVVATQIGEFVDASLTEIGFDVDFQAIDWATAFLPELTGQTFDMAMLSWSLGLPIDPDVSSFYTPEVDVPESGFNFGSFQNEELNQLLADARNPAETNNCDLETRRDMYLRVQEILFEEMPYLYLHVGESMTAVQPTLNNWRPTPYSRTYDVDAWDQVSEPIN